MFHFVYKTTNLINQKYYIGVHSTDDINDGYLGSGVLIKKAIKKYGRQNFKRDILKFTDTKHDAYMFEKSVVTEDLVKSNQCYNQALGGYGGNLGELNGMYGKTHTDEVKEKLSKLRKIDKNLDNSNKIFSVSHKQKLSKATRNRLADPTKNPMYGKKHSQESIEKMRNAQKGEKSWMHGKRGPNCHNYGRKHTEETKKQMSEARKGKCTIPPMPGKQNPRWKGYCVTPNGVFESMHEASVALSMGRSTIRKYCKSEKYPEWYITKEI